MKSFLPKSTQSIDLLKIFTILELIQTEQRHQRADLAFIIRQLKNPPGKNIPELSEAEQLGFSDSELGE